MNMIVTSDKYLSLQLTVTCSAVLVSLLFSAVVHTVLHLLSAHVRGRHLDQRVGPVELFPYDPLHEHEKVVRRAGGVVRPR